MDQATWRGIAHHFKALRQSGAVSLEDAATACQTLVPMPEGYCIDPDAGLNCLIVRGPAKCMVVTRAAIDEGRYLWEFGPVMERFIAVQGLEK